MLRRTTTHLLTRVRGEHGFGAISLVATLAIVGMIAAMAIPQLTKHGGSGGQGGQPSSAQAEAAAQDVQAKTMATDAQTAMATYAASSDQGYTGASPSALSGIEPTLVTSGTNQAYLASVNATQSSYVITIVNPLTHNSFTLSNSGGAISRTCTTAGSGGCPAGGTW
jgi:hypothetical protein